MRSHPLLGAWADFRDALVHYIRDGFDLARCRLTGGHERGTWREPSSYPHTWCRRCGWCEQTQSFDEERTGAIEGWYESEPLP